MNDSFGYYSHIYHVNLVYGSIWLLIDPGYPDILVGVGSQHLSLDLSCIMSRASEPARTSDLVWLQRHVGALGSPNQLVPWDAGASQGQLRRAPFNITTVDPAHPISDEPVKRDYIGSE